VQQAKPSSQPRPAKQQREGVAPPTDTFTKELPNGYYRAEYEINLPEGNCVGETSPLRYTAVTCQFDEFLNPTGGREGKPYTLRQQEKGMTTKMMIVVTMYNEDLDLFALSMEGVYKNIEYICHQEEKKRIKKAAAASDPRDPEAGVNERLAPQDLNSATSISWENIVVCIICDGRQKCPTEVKIALEMLGCYQANEGLMTDFQESPVQAHLFEFTTGVYLERGKNKSIDVKPAKYPMQILLCMKEQNKKKINSHGWAFRAFAPVLRPEVVVLLDMGTKPHVDAFYYFWQHFANSERLGGVCGEIQVDVPAKTMVGRWVKLLTDPLLAAQNFEYKMSNILDKSLQSLCGYITVLPGAFSAYRFAALEGRPLDEYFKEDHGGSNKPASSDIPKEKRRGCGCSGGALSTANKYLAEDRILCFEIFNKMKYRWLLRYIREAKATTDAPDDLGKFLNQRRRWLNGSLFAFIDGLLNMGQVFTTNHSPGRKFAFILEMMYLLLDTTFNLLGPMNFYAVFVLTLNSLAVTLNISTVLVYFGVILYLSIFIFGMVMFVGNNPKGSQKFYKGLAITWAIIMVLLTALLVYNSVLLFSRGASALEVFLFVLALLATYGLYFASSAVFLDIGHCFTSMIGYMLMLPVYINMMLPFALSNIHDISWGTRPEVPAAKELPKNTMKTDDAGKSQVVMSGLLKPGATLTVDVGDLKGRLRAAAEESEKKGGDGGGGGSVMIVSTAEREEKLQNRNKNVRFTLLGLFIFFNLMGAAAITYGGVSSQAVDLSSNGTSTNARDAATLLGAGRFVTIYLSVVFGIIFFFAAVRFVGCCLFRASTPRF
ncbi:Chitin synthase, class 1, partial [Quaeritorhiza haematococci]